jgi:hypothetical protein
MEEALRRSRRAHNLVIRGTFNRDIAVRREDIVFFALGSDPWTDAIIANALEADRGRSCAMLRHVPELQGTWRGFELLFSLSIDPRPLYRAGYDPTHLFRALGFLRLSTRRLLLSDQGIQEKQSSIAWKSIKRDFDRSRDTHLGRRDGPTQRMRTFKQNYQIEEWEALLTQTLTLAQDILSEELDEYMDEVAEEAREVFEKQAMGLRAMAHWQEQYAQEQPVFVQKESEEYEQVSAALLEGIRHPLRQLESACFWILQDGNAR